MTPPSAHAPHPLILIPHSKGQAEGGDGPAWQVGASLLPALDDDRARVLATVARSMGPTRSRVPAPAIAELLGAQGATLAAAVAANRSVATSPTLPAIERYRGVLYDELDHASLRPAARHRLDQRVLVVNALTGAAAPTDPLPAHRLELTAALPRLGRLARWWRPRITAALAPRVEGAVVWDLLPHGHGAAWAPADLALARHVTVRFVDEQGRTLSHWNKLLKGALVRYLVTHDVVDPAALGGFAHPTGYRFDAGASDLGARRADVVFTCG